MERDAIQDHASGAPGQLLETALLAFTVSGFWHLCYFLLAPWIWDQNLAFRPEELTPWILEWTNERDGVEIYALYLLSLLNLGSVLALSGLVRRISGGGGRRAVLLGTAALSAAFLVAIGFTLPLNTWQQTPLATVASHSGKILLATGAALFPLCHLQRRSPRWALALAALLLAPICFVAAGPITWADYSYVFAPALRVVQGTAWSDIYFQYDLLLSLCAALWMKLGWGLPSMQLLGQASFFLTILGLYYLAARMFRKKELALFLLAALVLGRLYASPWEVTSVFQVTPLRLDLWLPLLMLVHFRGARHWSAALYCGLLLILHKTFGIIYSAAYLQLLLTLCLFEYLDAGEREAPLAALTRFGRRLLVPVAVLALCGTVSHLLLGNPTFPNYSGYYQKIGIGFIRISPTSFYWYVLPMLGAAALLIFRLRRKLPVEYLGAALLLVFCAIGNSIYFFGRSHEHNILNISLVLLFLFFLLLDLVARSQEEGSTRTTRSWLTRHGSVAAAATLIVLLVVSYSGTISSKVQGQYLNVTDPSVSTVVDPSGSPGFYDFLSAIKAATGNSAKVYFLREDDFALYYYGGYTPVGYCNPFLTWIFTKDLTSFLQALLDQGYYLVCGPNMTGFLDGLRCRQTGEAGDSIIVTNSTAQRSAP